MALARPCLTCSIPTTRGTRCPLCEAGHQAQRNHERDAKRGSSTQRGYGSDYRKARTKLLAGDPACHWCGALATTADHLIPLARGGGVEGNLVPSCGPCNFARGASMQGPA